MVIVGPSQVMKFSATLKTFQIEIQYLIKVLKDSSD